MPQLLDIKSQKIYPDISAFRILLLLHELRVEGGTCQELLLLWICAQTRLLRLNRARHRLYRNVKRIKSTFTKICSGLARAVDRRLLLRSQH